MSARFGNSSMATECISPKCLNSLIHEISLFVSFDVWFYVPLNNYGHVVTVSYPNHTVPGHG